LKPSRSKSRSSVGCGVLRREEALEVDEQLASVREPGQRIRNGLLLRELVQAAVLSERRGQADDDGEERGGGQDEREHVQPVEVVVHEDADAD
jgi:hypothetical protein